jgi:hypothetical protein
MAVPHASRDKAQDGSCQANVDWAAASSGRSSTTIRAGPDKHAALSVLHDVLELQPYQMPAVEAPDQSLTAETCAAAMQTARDWVALMQARGRGKQAIVARLRAAGWADAGIRALRLRLVCPGGRCCRGASAAVTAGGGRVRTASGRPEANGEAAGRGFRPRGRASRAGERGHRDGVTAAVRLPPWPGLVDLRLADDAHVGVLV